MKTKYWTNYAVGQSTHKFSTSTSAKKVLDVGNVKPPCFSALDI